VSDRRIRIRGARILDPAAQRDEAGDVLIEGGVIVAVGGELDAGGAEVIEANGAWVAPAFVDLHTHLREPHRVGRSIRGGRRFCGGRLHGEHPAGER